MSLRRATRAPDGSILHMSVGDRALRLDASRQEALRHAAELIAQA